MDFNALMMTMKYVEMTLTTFSDQCSKFDASIVCGTGTGRMIYAGINENLRYADFYIFRGMETLTE